MSDSTGLASKLIGGLIALVIGVSLVTTVANQSALATSNANVSGAANALTTLVPVIFVAAIVLGAMAFMRGKK